MFSSKILLLLHYKTKQENKTKRKNNTVTGKTKQKQKKTRAVKSINYFQNKRICLHNIFVCVSCV